MCWSLWAHYYRNVWKKLCIAIGAAKVGGDDDDAEVEAI